MKETQKRVSVIANESEDDYLSQLLNQATLKEPSDRLRCGGKEDTTSRNDIDPHMREYCSETDCSSISTLQSSTSAWRDSLPKKQHDEGNRSRHERRSILKTRSYSSLCLSRSMNSVDSKLGMVLSQSRCVSQDSEDRIEQSSSVKFERVSVREYDRVLGDNPSCRTGAPISLDWSYSERSQTSVEDYEDERSRRPNYVRRSAKFPIHKMKRDAILKEWAYTDDELDAAKQEVKKIRRSRSRNSFMSHFWRLEYGCERLRRRVSKGARSKKG